MSQDDSHGFAFRGEWEVGQDIVLLLHFVWVFNFDHVLVSFNELHAQRVCKFHEGHFIRGGGLELFFGIVVWIRIHWGDVMTQS